MTKPPKYTYYIHFVDGGEEGTTGEIDSFKEVAAEINRLRERNIPCSAWQVTRTEIVEKVPI